MLRITRLPCIATLTLLALTAGSSAGCGGGAGESSSAVGAGAGAVTGPGSGSGAGTGAGSGNAGGGGGLPSLTASVGTGSPVDPPVAQYPELFYSVDDLLVRIELDASNGAPKPVQVSKLQVELPLGQNALTMLPDGSLLGARLSKADMQSYFYWIAAPPRDGGDVTPTVIGVMPSSIMVEGLYTDCEGRLYAMDTGSDDTDAVGNRLLRFTGDVKSGDFAFAVVSDLATADVADIDDMSPGIVDNAIIDNPGLAIDTGRIHAFNFETGTGSEVAQGGTYGIHALGGSLFQDGRSRLFVLSSNAELLELNPKTFAASAPLVVGPKPAEGIPGWSGLTGPLTHCESGFTPPK